VRAARGFSSDAALVPLPAQSGVLDSFPFDPVGLNSPENATKEVKNGRLAMVCCLACPCLCLHRAQSTYGWNVSLATREEPGFRGRG
jgi:Chlorophyll A-B binding protein